ncbi:MAG: NfeD family protein [Clostridiales Family XIII bacterium]|jgi:membrane protein implicated in regulation of membrane protease activity|nr:NfeD family protein [Clostridiales Family XIII bacterium]
MGIFDMMVWSDYLALIWIGAAVFLALVEAATLGLATIWFAIGAVAASIAALTDASFLAQVVVFLVVSVILLIFTRPLAVKRLKIGREKNVTERMEGRRGIMTEAAPPFGTGLAKVDGALWTAVPEDPARGIENGVTVDVVRIEGVKLVVKPFAGAE